MPLPQFFLDKVLKALEKKQDAMQKLLEEDIDTLRKSLQVQHPPVESLNKQSEAHKDKKSKKLYPKSALFKHWGENLSEEEQREAQGLFEKYGYNVFLSDRLPLDRALPETRDPR